MIVAALFALTAQSVPVVTLTPPQLPPPPACASPAHAAFDFWLGDWDVYPNLNDPTKKAPLVAKSRIERLYGGCAVRENWMPLRGTGGGSLNTVDPASGIWRQFWIGSDGNTVEFSGGPVAKGMVLTGFSPAAAGPGQSGLVRMTFSVIDADTVRQRGEVSIDHGLSWTDGFDFLYRRAKPAG